MNPSINNSGAARGRRALYVWLLAALAPVTKPFLATKIWTTGRAAGG